MRLLWARVGVPYSPATGLPIEAQTVSQMVDRVMAMPEGTRLLLLAPVVRDRKGEYRKELAELQRRGFTRVKVDGKLYEIGEVPALNRKIKHEIEAVVDRVVVRDGIAPRLADSFETALGMSDGVVYAENADTRRAHRVLLALRLPGQRLLDRGDRAAAVQLQQPARRLPGLRRPRRRNVSSIRRWSCRTSGVSWPTARSRRGPARRAPYYDQTLQSLAKHFKVTTQHALGRPAGARARRHPVRQRRRSDRVHLQGRRARLYGDQTVRRRDPQPRSAATAKPTAPGCARSWPLPGREALRRLPRRPPEAGGAGGARSPARTSPRLPNCRSAPRARWFGGVIDTLTPQRAGNRAAHPARDRRAAAVPGRCRARLPDARRAARRRCRAARASASGWPARSAPA